MVTSEKRVIEIPKFNSHFIEILRNRDFLFLWLAQALSVFCAQMLNFVLAYIIFDTTGSSFYVSLMFLFYILPVPLLGLFAGILVDHVSRRNIMIITNFLQALIVLLYIGIDRKWLYIYPVIFLYSIVDEFYYPSEAAMLPTLVDKKHLPVANFLFTLASYGSMMIGFSMAGEIIKLLGTKITFLLASGVLFAAMLVSIFIRKDRIEKKLSFFKENPISKMWREIKGNYLFLFRNRVLHLTMLILLLFQVSVATLAIAAPKIGTSILGFNFLDLGVRLIAPIFLGSFIGILVVDHYIVGNRKSLITGGMFGAGICISAMGLLSLKGITYYPLMALLLVLLGFTAIAVLITGQTVVQHETPVEIMGRVSGTYKLFQSVVILFPTLLAGAIIDLLGIYPVIFGLTGIIFTVAFILFVNRHKNFRAQTS